MSLANREALSEFPEHMYTSLALKRLIIYDLPAGEIKQLKEFATELDHLRTTSEREISQLTEQLESVTADRRSSKSGDNDNDVITV